MKRVTAKRRLRSNWDEKADECAALAANGLLTAEEAAECLAGADLKAGGGGDIAVARQAIDSRLAEKGKQILTLPEASRIYGIPYPTLAEWAREGKITARKSGGTWLVAREVIERKTMTNAEKAKKIVASGNGHESECLDWLEDGDGSEMSLKELITAWQEIGFSYQA